MTGAAIIGELLCSDATFVTDIAPVENIKLSRLPDGVSLTAVLVRTISSVDRQPLKRKGYVRVTERVSVTVRAASYRNQVAAIRAVRKVCAGRTGNIGGGVGVSILTAGTGPDLNGPADSFEQAQDFRVSFVEPA